MTWCFFVYLFVLVARGSHFYGSIYFGWHEDTIQVLLA